MLIAAAAAASDKAPIVSVTLDLPAQLLLPGVPFDMTVTSSNLSKQRVAVGAIASVIVTPQHGQPMRMAKHATVVESFSQVGPNLTLEPGQSLSGFIEWSADWLYADEAVTIPGTYEFALDLTGSPSAVDVEDGIVYAGPLRSGTATLTRLQPVGEDAAVWSRLTEAAGGRWPSHGFGSRQTSICQVHSEFDQIQERR